MKIRRLTALLLSGLLLLTTGCLVARPVTNPVSDQKAAAQAVRLRELNQKIQTAKGMATIQVEAGIRKERFRIAWAARYPDRLRLVLLASGHPVETILATGEIVTFVSHIGKHKPHTAVSNDPDMERYVGLPVRLSELISLLLGRFPIQPFDDAWFDPDRPSTLLLRQDYASRYQELALSDDGRLESIRLRKGEADPFIYEVRFFAFGEKKGHIIPFKMTVKDNRFRTVSINISMFTPNAPLKESVFRLTQTGS